MSVSKWFGTDTNDLSVSLNGTVFEIANTMQLLGISIDKDLNFNVHVKETVRMAASCKTVLKPHPYSCEKDAVSGLFSPSFNLLFHRLVPLWQAK